MDNRTTSLARREESSPFIWNIHPVFHASLLTPYVETDSHGPNFSQPPPDLIRGENEYEVETIRKHRCFGRNKKLQYLLKWRGYPESDNTWEPIEQLHAPQLLKEYHVRHPQESIKTLLTQRQNYSLFPASACLRSYHLSTAHVASLPPPVTVISSITSLFSIPPVVSTSAPCAPNDSEVAAASTSTSLTRTNSTPPLSIAFNPERITRRPHWPSFMSPLPHSHSNQYSPMIIGTQKSFSNPSFAHHRIHPTNSTSSTLDGNATTPLTLIPSNTNTSARRRTAATTCNQRTTHWPSLVTISPISPMGQSHLTHVCNTLRCFLFRLTHPTSSCRNGSGAPF